MLRHASAASAICQCHELIMMINAVRLCAAAALSVLPRRPDQTRPVSQPASQHAVSCTSYSGSRTYQTQYCTTPLAIGRASPAPEAAAAAAAAAAAIATAADRLVSGVGIVRPGSDTRATTFHWISSIVAAGGPWSSRQTVFILLFFEPPREPWREPRPL